MTITPDRHWTRAMHRAINEGLKPTRQVDGSYRVRSTSHPGMFHVVTLDEAGHITHCGDCLGWERGGRQHPCKHAAAVALAVSYLLGAHIAPRRETDRVVYSDHSRRQIFREEVA